MTRRLYRPEYAESWALVIGIDKYANAPPLGYACNDAMAVAEALETSFAFPKENITCLLNQDATGNAIRSSYLAFSDCRTGPDDRLVVFYAGHGHTRQSHRGETGFLVPVEGNIDNLASLLRWDDLTRNAELIPAKHVLFVMDACYGGLALARGMTGGRVRFLQDMLQRFSRQVLTAGKADEVVADSGGPLQGHSVFTGHLLEGLAGKAEYGDGVITASTLMSYTYNHVATDSHSHQTPHYGFLEGDGDFIFQAPILKTLSEEEGKGKDVLIEIPATTAPEKTATPNLADRVKDMLSDHKHRIDLHDTIVDEIRKVMAATNEDRFPVQTRNVTGEDFAERLGKYEAIMHDMIEIMLCLSYWGEGQQASLIRKCISRLTDHFKATSGRTLWINLRWYPIILLTYAGGLGAIAAEQYKNLAAVFLAEIPSFRHRGRMDPAILVVNEAALELTRVDAFKLLPGHEKQYVPRSEYLFKVLQPIIDDTLFVGKTYESLFDRYEVLQALVYADLHEKEGRSVWGPIGRFGWKYNEFLSHENPFKNLVAEAEEKKSAWLPLQAGLFQGSYDRFIYLAGEYAKILDGLHWW